MITPFYSHETLPADWHLLESITFKAETVFCQCHTCGFVWRRGSSGSHECTTYLQKTVAAQNKLNINFLRLLKVSAYNLYKATLCSSNAPKMADLRQELWHPKPGDLVLEISSFHQNLDSLENIGRLKEIKDWPYAEDGTGPSRKVYVLELFDGREFTWENCDFIKVFETLE